MTSIREILDGTLILGDATGTEITVGPDELANLG